MKLLANISTLFTELPFCKRLYAAANAGFEGVEIQFPYSENLFDIKNASAKSGMDIELINLPAGNWDEGDVGLAALPDRQDEFLQSMETALFWAKELNVNKVNVLSGRSDRINRDLMLDTLVSNLEHTADYFAEINVQVQLEVINSIDMPGFFAGNLDVGVGIIKKVNHPNLRLQFDFYHMARLGLDLVETIQCAGKMIGHVQFADAPGRHEPGTGTINFESAIKALKSIGYNGAVSAEYFPAAGTPETLGWMAGFKDLMK